MNVARALAATRVCVCARNNAPRRCSHGGQRRGLSRPSLPWATATLVRSSRPTATRGRWRATQRAFERQRLGPTTAAEGPSYGRGPRRACVPRSGQCQCVPVRKGRHPPDESKGCRLRADNIVGQHGHCAELMKSQVLHQIHASPSHHGLRIGQSRRHNLAHHDVCACNELAMRKRGLACMPTPPPIAAIGGHPPPPAQKKRAPPNDQSASAMPVTTAASTASVPARRSRGRHAQTARARPQTLVGGRPVRASRRPALQALALPGKGARHRPRHEKHKQTHPAPVSVRILRTLHRTTHHHRTRPRRDASVRADAVARSAIRERCRVLPTRCPRKGGAPEPQHSGTARPARAALQPPWGRPKCMPLSPE